MITDLVQIKKLAGDKWEENLRFRQYIKTRPYPAKRFREIALEIESRIDCGQCANCCREATVAPNERDIERLAEHLGVSEEQFRAQYMMEDTDGEAVLKQTDEGCVFLEGNRCTVYEQRPRTCRNFPHLVRSDWSLESRMMSVVNNSRICPIVYNALEAYKDVLQFARGARRRKRGKR